MCISYEGDLSTPCRTSSTCALFNIVLSNLPYRALPLTGEDQSHVPERTYLGKDADGLGLVRDSQPMHSFLKPVVLSC